MTSVLTQGPTLMELPLAFVKESPLNPRRHYNEAKLEELAESMGQHGQLTPCLVRPMGDCFELAAGHRRRRAAERANLQTLSCLVREMTDAEFLEVLTVENLQRVDVHPLDEAIGYEQLLKLPGYDVAGVAGKVGKSESYVYQRLRLVDLTPKAQEAFFADQFTAGHALLIARLQPADQAEALKYVLGGHRDVTASDLRAWIGRSLVRDLHGVPFLLDDAELVPAAGPCATCPKRTGHQRELMPSLDDGAQKKGVDRCLDRACFERKTKAGLAQRLESLQAKHGDVLELSTHYHSEKKGGPLTSDRWWEAKKATPGAQPGLVVDGWRDVGKLLWVTTRAPRGQGSSISPQERRANEKRKRDRARRVAIVEAVKAKLSGTIAEAAMREIAVSFFHEMVSESQKVTCRFLGVEPGKSRHGGRDYRGAFAAHLGELDAAGVSKVLQLLPMMPILTGFADDRALTPIAERHGVDLAAIEAGLKESKKAKRPAPAKSGKKAATKRARGAEAKTRAGAKKSAKTTRSSAAKKVGKKAVTEPFNPDQHPCESCGCTLDDPCPDGCSWDAKFLKLDRAVCSECASLVRKREAAS